MPDRAIVFVDGSNWYHSLKDIGVNGPGELDYAKISRKLAGPARDWVGTRYYIGPVNQGEAPLLYADQRRFLARLVAKDARITTHFGRLETRLVENSAALELRALLGALPERLPTTVYQRLGEIANAHASVRVTAEKAVDVKLAVDMVMLAHASAYEAAYLLSADGDFTPAVEAVRSLGKRVYVASPAQGAQLARAANTYIPLKLEWFADCW